MTADDNSATSGFGFGYGPGVVPLQQSTAVLAAPIRLAILETDTPQPKALERNVSNVLSISAYDVVNDPESYPALQDVDAVLITGSKATAFHDDPWIVKLVEYTKRAIDSGVKVVGICFGHQIVGRAMGAKLGTGDKGWEIAVTEVDLTPKGKEIFQLEKMRIHQMHRDVVFNFPKDAVSLGYNALCRIHSMYSPGKYITVQGHPEFTEEIMTEILFNRHTSGVFSDDMYADAMKRSPVPHDGVAIARAFIKFMREG
ncbi:Putative glutamine amidotransferase-like protein C13C5.04 [Cladobotryum mycophilum]|uniref:Glutamine amidotransferase-like protein C13C5.04 n=1 Tax=Cladobotryum mycophilum TaxID=491253 RepID=A0ABR0SGU2_9HYPO